MKKICRRVLRKNTVEEGRWCRLEVTLKTDEEGGGSPTTGGSRTRTTEGSLSICGSEGRIVDGDSLREEALQYWIGYFEDAPESVVDMLKRFKEDMMRWLKEGMELEEAAARVVLEVDGEFHGLDIEDEMSEAEKGEDGSYLVVESCGQIREELVEWFPEVKPWIKWHLNDMKAGCEHQEEMGWGGGRDVALDRASCTPVQLEVLDSRKDEKFQAEIFKGCLGAPCPKCGYRYGTQWKKRALPEGVVEWVVGLGCE
jgi:hypothetical protein